MPDGKRLTHREIAARWAMVANKRLEVLMLCRKLLCDADRAAKGGMTIESWQMRRMQCIERIDEATKQ